MLKLLIAGVGFCIIVPKKNVKKIKKYFLKNICPTRLVIFLKEKIK